MVGSSLASDRGGYPGCLTTERSDIFLFEKGCEARQSEIRAGSVLAYVTKRIAAITPPRALVVLRFLLNTTKETHRFVSNPITLYYLTNYIRSAETGEIFGRWLSFGRKHPSDNLPAKDFRRKNGRNSDISSQRPRGAQPSIATFRLFTISL